MKLWCCSCQKYSDAELITGRKAYPHRPDLSGLLFYRCSVCGNFVGTHKRHGRDGDVAALGCIPNAEIKHARQCIHAILDPLWQGKKSGTRKKIYKMISDRLGYEYHTAQTRSIEECRKVYSIIREIKREFEKNEGVVII